MAPHFHSPTVSLAMTGLLVGSSLALTGCDQPGPTAATPSSDASFKSEHSCSGHYP
jgi:hypothetical protein